VASLRILLENDLERMLKLTKLTRGANNQSKILSSNVPTHLKVQPWTAFRSSKSWNTLIFCKRPFASTSDAPQTLHRSGQPLKYSFGITSYFMLPEQGMENYEILSRSSLFLVKARKPDQRKQIHILAPAHVTHPWLYRQFYPGPNFDWLKFVREEAVVNKLGIREVSKEPDAVFDVQHQS
jgi:hypothetical protein